MSVIRKSSLSALALLLAASAAHAAIYTVTMSNGTSFETRYRPMTAEWDTNIAMLRTDQGNWIALKKSEIVDVASNAQMTGFGYQIDETTLFLGWSAGQGLVDEEAAAAAEGDAAAAGEAAVDAPAATGGSDTPGGYTMEQFVTVPSTGVVPGGIPLGTGSSSGGTATGSNRPGS